MPQALQIVRKAAVRGERVTDAVTLRQAERAALPAALTSDAGAQIAVALERPGPLKAGDALKLDDGGLVLVKAAAEALLEIRAESPARLLRAAWHLGSHHVRTEIAADALYVEEDAAVAELVRGQGCSLTAVSRAFEPEQDAHLHGPDCGHAHHHGHHRGHRHGDEGHGEAHAHAHSHAQAHAHVHAQAHAQAHAPAQDCGCGHHHDHGHGHGAAHGHKGHARDR